MILFFTKDEKSKGFAAPLPDYCRTLHFLKQHGIQKYPVLPYSVTCRVQTTHQLLWQIRFVTLKHFVQLMLCVVKNAGRKYLTLAPCMQGMQLHKSVGVRVKLFSKHVFLSRRHFSQRSSWLKLCTSSMHKAFPLQSISENRILTGWHITRQALSSIYH